MHQIALESPLLQIAGERYEELFEDRFLAMLQLSVEILQRQGLQFLLEHRIAFLNDGWQTLRELVLEGVLELFEYLVGVHLGSEVVYDEGTWSMLQFAQI